MTKDSRPLLKEWTLCFMIGGLTVPEVRILLQIHRKKLPLASMKFSYLTFFLRKLKIWWSTSGASIKYLSLASCDASCFTMWYLTSIAALHHKDNIKSSVGKKGFLYKYQKTFLFPLAALNAGIVTTVSNTDWCTVTSHHFFSSGWRSRIFTKIKVWIPHKLHSTPYWTKIH